MLRNIYRLIRLIRLRAPGFMIRHELATLRRRITGKTQVMLPKEKEQSMATLQMSDELREALHSLPYACLLTETNERAAVILKLPAGEDIESFRDIPVRYWFEADYYPEGAIIALILEFHDDPASRFVMDTFVNLASPHDLELITKMSGQVSFDIHFLNPALDLVFTKRLRLKPAIRQELAALIAQALDHNAQCPPVDYDAFEIVRERYMADRPR